MTGVEQLVEEYSRVSSNRQSSLRNTCTVGNLNPINVSVIQNSDPSTQDVNLDVHGELASVFGAIESDAS